MSSDRKNIITVNGFGHGSLTVAETWALYNERYLACKMVDNGIGVPPLPVPDTQQWMDEIRAQRLRLKPEKRANPT
jgi:hypothetical protein